LFDAELSVEVDRITRERTRASAEV